MARVRNIIAIVMLLTSITFVGYAIWPTPWRYGASLTVADVVYPVRFHRVSDRGEVWIPAKGWTDVTRRAESDPLAGYRPDWRERQNDR